MHPYLENGNYDGVILDIMLPKLDGISVLKKIRAQGNTVPVLILSAKSALEDKVMGLDCGADDYLTKPFATKELLARIRAMTRRRGDTLEPNLAFEDLELSCLYKIADDILNERSVAVDNLNSASMQSLYLVGTSAGGMQPKAIIAINEDDGTVKSGQVHLEGNFKYFILKFDRVGHFPYTLMEKTYYDMALACGIKMMPSRLITIDGHSHFITERFDRVGNDKLHIQTLAALSPDADCYEDLMRSCMPLFSTVFSRLSFTLFS